MLFKIKIYIKLVLIFVFSDVLVIGDSHAAVFNSSLFNRKYKRNFFVFCVSGATISGLKNPNSKTQAMPLFKSALNFFRKKDVIVNIGEVDTGFLIFLKSQNENIDPYILLESTVASYLRFIDFIIENGRNVICISAPLPTIRDNVYLGDIANIRREVKATQLERTRLTCYFNKRIQQFCIDRGVRYVMLDDLCVDSNSGVLSDDLYNINPSDHHYDLDRYAELISENLPESYFTDI